MSRLHFNLDQSVGSHQDPLSMPPLGWSDATKVAHNLASLHQVEYGRNLRKVEPQKRTAYGFRARGRYGELGYSMTVSDRNARRPARPTTEPRRTKSARWRKEKRQGADKDMLLPQLSAECCEPTGQFAPKTLLPLLKTSDQFLKRPATQSGQAEQSLDIRMPARFLCTKCTSVIERDSMFWHTEWQKGSDLLMRFLDDHMQRYPYFLSTFLNRFREQITAALELDPLLLAMLASNEATKGLMIKLVDADPSILLELSGRVPTPIIVNVIHKNQEAFIEYVVEQPDCLKEAELSPEAIAQALIELGPEAKKAVFDEAFKDDDAMMCSVSDMIATMEAMPETMGEVLATEANTATLVALLKDNTDLLNAILAGLKPRIAEVLTEDPAGLLELLLALDAEVLLGAIRTMSERDVNFLQPLFVDLEALEVYLNKNMPFTLKMIISICKAKPQFAKTLWESVSELAPVAMASQDAQHIQIFIDEHPDLFAKIRAEAAEEARKEAEERTVREAEERAAAEAEAKAASVVPVEALLATLKEQDLELGEDMLCAAQLNATGHFNTVLKRTLLRNKDKTRNLLDEHPDLKSMLLNMLASRVYQRRDKAGNDEVEVIVVDADVQLDLSQFEEIGRKKEKKTDDVHVWDKFLGGKIKTADKAMGERALVQFIWKVYEAKIAADAVDVKQGNRIATLPEFVLDYFMMMYGQKKAVKTKLRVLIKSLQACAPSSPLVSVFNRLCRFHIDSPLETSTLTTILWGLNTLLAANNTGLRLELNMLDNQERMAIKKATGKEINLASMKLEPALHVLKQICATFDGAFADSEKAMRASAFSYEGGKLVGLVHFIEAFTALLLEAEASEREQLAQLFQQVDADGSGVVDYEEFVALIQSMPAMKHLQPYQISKMFNAATEDGEMTEAVFTKLAQGEMKSQLGQNVLENIDNLSSEDASYLNILSGHVKSLFAEFDEAGTGEISIEAFPQLMKKVEEGMSADEMKRIIRLIDVDGSGAISFTEFLDWWRDYALNQAFVKFDTDGSGELNTEELNGLLSSLGIAADNAAMAGIIARIDVDQSGCVSFAELVQWFAVFDARKAFEQYDADGSGEIGTEELNLLLKDLGAHVTPEVLHEALVKLDKDQTGSLSFEEFLPWWSAMQKQRRKDRNEGVFEKADSASANHMLSRRRSDQMNLLNNNQAYLKMSALRESLKREEEERKKKMLEKIAKDYGLDLKELQDEHMAKEPAEAETEAAAAEAQ